MEVEGICGKREGGREKMQEFERHEGVGERCVRSGWESTIPKSRVHGVRNFLI